MQEKKTKLSKKKSVRNKRRKDQRPAEIIDSAIRCWSEKGFADTKLDDVAAGAGVAKGTIYLYFSSKEDLFEAAVRERLVGTMKRADEMAKVDNLTTQELLKKFYDIVYEQLFVNDSATILKILIAEGHRFPSLVSMYKEVGISKGMQTIRSILARGVERNELNENAINIDPRLIMAPVIMFMLWNKVFDKSNKKEFDRLISNHMDILLNGLT